MTTQQEEDDAFLLAACHQVVEAVRVARHAQPPSWRSVNEVAVARAHLTMALASVAVPPEERLWAGEDPPPNRPL